jgi:GTP pyrophosphokinase
LPGDEIVGYVTRGRGVSVHQQSCPNIQRYRQTEPDRLIDVKWGRARNGIFQVEIMVVCQERERLVVDIMSIMAETKTPVNALRMGADKRTKQATGYLKIEVKSLDQLDYLMQRIRRVKGVLEVSRINNKRE